MEERSELSWQKADFLAANEEVPDRLINDDKHSEGELMTEDELAEWLQDTTVTFAIIRKKDNVRFNELYRNYVLDIQYLVKIGKITVEEADELINEDRFEL